MKLHTSLQEVRLTVIAIFILMNNCLFYNTEKSLFALPMKYALKQINHHNVNELTTNT